MLPDGVKTMEICLYIGGLFLNYMHVGNRQWWKEQLSTDVPTRALVANGRKALRI